MVRLFSSSAKAITIKKNYLNFSYTILTDRTYPTFLLWYPTDKSISRLWTCCSKSRSEFVFYVQNLEQNLCFLLKISNRICVFCSKSRTEFVFFVKNLQQNLCFLFKISNRIYALCLKSRTQFSWFRNCFRLFEIANKI